jgi:hypothetical protein
MMSFLRSAICSLTSANPHPITSPDAAEGIIRQVEEWFRYLFGLVALAMGVLLRGFFALLASCVLAPSEGAVGAAPSGFPASGNGLWFAQPGNTWVREWLPIGNGYLAGKFARLQLNI